MDSSSVVGTYAVSEFSIETHKSSGEGEVTWTLEMTAPEITGLIEGLERALKSLGLAEKELKAKMGDTFISSDW